MVQMKKLPFNDNTKELEVRFADIRPDTMPSNIVEKQIPKETKCQIVVDNPKGVIRMLKYIRGGCIDGANVMPDFDDIKVIKDQAGNDRVVAVKFCDGTETRATLDGADVYSLEQGISVCVAKRLLAARVGINHCSSMYNKIIKRAMQVKHMKENARELEVEECKRKEKKFAKLAEKKRNRDLRRAAAKREAEIELRKEAYIRAMREMQKENAE